MGSEPTNYLVVFVTELGLSRRPFFRLSWGTYKKQGCHYLIQFDDCVVEGILHSQLKYGTQRNNIDFHSGL